MKTSGRREVQLCLRLKSSGLASVFSLLPLILLVLFATIFTGFAESRIHSGVQFYVFIWNAIYVSVFTIFAFLHLVFRQVYSHVSVHSTYTSFNAVYMYMQLVFLNSSATYTETKRRK